MIFLHVFQVIVKPKLNVFTCNVHVKWSNAKQVHLCVKLSSSFIVVTHVKGKSGLNTANGHL